MDEGFILMNLSKHKRWRAHTVIAKQQLTEQTHLVCLHTAEKYGMVNAQNYYETAREK